MVSVWRVIVRRVARGDCVDGFACPACAGMPANGSLSALICDPRADCPPCVPTFTGIAARCTAGRCAVVPSP